MAIAPQLELSKSWVILADMNWLDKRVDKVAAMKTRREALNLMLVFMILGLFAIGEIIKGPTNAQFPANHVAYSIRYWLSCVAAPVCLLNVAVGSMIFRRIGRPDSSSLSAHEGSR